MSESSTEQRQKGHEASASAKTTSAKTIKEVFNESMRGYERVLKTGVELQEQSIRLWSDLLSRIGSPDQFQSKLQELNADFLPAFRKQMEEVLGASNLVSNQSVALLRKSTGLLEATSIPDAQRRIQDYLEALMGATRVNVHLALNTTARMMNFWNESAAHSAHTSHSGGPSPAASK